MSDELDDVRRQLRQRAWTGLVTGSADDTRLSRRILGGGLLGGIALLALALALLAAAEGEVAIAVFFLLVAGGVGALVFRVLRPAACLSREGARARAALLARERELVAGLGTSERQPSAYAQMMHARFPVGPSPEEALRRLPAHASRWRVAFHRHLGWGLLLPTLIGLGLVSLYVSAAVR